MTRGPYNWSDDLSSGFMPSEPVKISSEKNPYKRGSLVSSSFQPKIMLGEGMTEFIQQATRQITQWQFRMIETACQRALYLGCGVLVIESSGNVLYAEPCALVPEYQKYMVQHNGSTEDLHNLVNSVYDDLRARKSADDEDGAATSAP